MAETGCALIALVVTVGGVWWFIHSVVQQGAHRRRTEERLKELETQIARLSTELRGMAADAPAPTAPSGDRAETSAAPSSEGSTTAPTPDVIARAAESQASPSTRRDSEAAPVWPHPDAESSGDLTEATAGVEHESEATADPGDAAAAPPDSDAPNAPSTPTPATPSEPSGPPKPPKPPIEWEQWLGVRGVAVLGGIVLALAALYFVRYSIDQGWLSPVVRVALLFLSGVVSLGFGEHLRRKEHVFPANSLQGAGLVMLYAATWAARNLYDLIGSGLSFGLFALITVAGGLLAVRHASMVIAVLGLLGGFATPLMIASDEPSTLGLFGYLLLLNVGISAVSRRAQWPILSALSLIGTVLYQAAWVFGAMEERLGIGVLILGVFAVFFLVTALTSKSEDDAPAWQRLFVVLGALFTPFVFALYFASQTEIDGRLLSVAGLLFLLNGSASWLARRLEQPLAPIATTAGTLAIVGIWPFQRSFEFVHSIDALVAVALLPLLHTVSTTFTPWRRQPGDGILWSLPQLVATAFAVLWIPIGHAIHGWEHVPSIWHALAILLIAGVGLFEARRQWRAARGAQSGNDEPETTARPAWGTTWALLSAIGLGLFVTVNHLMQLDGPDEALPRALFQPTPMLGLVGLAILWQVLAVRWARAGSGVSRTTRNVEWGLAALPFAAFLPLLPHSQLASPLLNTGLALGLGVLAALSARRIHSGRLFAAGIGATALTQSAVALWSESLSPVDPSSTGGGAGHLPVLGVLLGTALLMLFWPSFTDGSKTSNTRWPLAAWRAAALSPVLFAPIVLEVFSSAFPDLDAPALPLVALAAASVIALRRSSDRCAEEHRTSVQAWFGGAALTLLATAIPLQLDREWITVGWALLAFGLVLLWKRVDHAGLKLVALGLGLAVAIRLLVNPEVLGYHEPRAPFGLPVIGWLLYTYLVPAAALLLGARILERHEVPRIRTWEPFATPARAWVAAILGGLAVAISFAWINLTIFDAFADGDRLQIDLGRMPARDLTLSVAWALFAIGLLVAGVARQSKVLRWSSLAMLFATIVKVFLYDLGELEDLYRVASLVGLAFSLLAVSVLYQRFVFGGASEADDSGETDDD